MYLTPLQRKELAQKSDPLFIDRVIGIDPDLKKSGWAMWSRKRACFVEIYNLTFTQFSKHVATFPVGSVLFVMSAGWLNSKPNFHDVHIPARMENASPEAIEKYILNQRLEVAVRVGINHGVGLLQCQKLRELGHDEHLIEYRPTTEKWDKNMIARQTGYTGISNKETRDAMQTAWFHK